MTVLIDTNVLVYAWDRSEKVKQAKSIEILNIHRHSAFVSVQNLSEFCAVMLRKNCDQVWLSRVISLYSSVMTVLPIHSNDVAKAIQAMDRYKLSYWDAQIWAVAHTNRIPVIYSEDGPTGQDLDGVSFQNPL